MARAKQFQEKEMRFAEQASIEKESFFKVITEQKENENKERRIANQRQDAFYNHKNDILLQIQSNSDTKKQMRMDYLEEGRKIRISQADEILKLETIKANKLQNLGQLGIQSKYLSELQKKKIAI